MHALMEQPTPMEATPAKAAEAAEAPTAPPDANAAPQPTDGNGNGEQTSPAAAPQHGTHPLTTAPVPIDGENDPRLPRVGFARLKGVYGCDVDYYMKKYEIIIGRRSKSTPVDVVLGDSMSISRKHAKIVFDFRLHIWMLKVLGKNGVSIGKILYTPSAPPIPLNSKDLLLFGDKNEPVQLYFLLPAAGTRQM